MTIETRTTKAGDTAYRARKMIAGKVRTGPWRCRLEHAVVDVDELAHGVQPAGLERDASRLSTALVAIVQEARARGRSVGYIERHLKGHGAYLLRMLGDIDLRRLSRAAVLDFVLRARAAGRADNTLAEKDLQLLWRACAAVGVAKPPMKPGDLPSKGSRVRTWVSKSTVAQWCERIDNPAHRALLRFVFSTGIRAGELERLEPSDLDLVHGCVHIRTAKDRRNPREVPCPVGVLREVLDHLPLPLARNYGTQVCHRLAKRLGDPRISLRTLRHSFATHLVSSGIDLSRVSRLLGHRRLSTTDIYAHAVRGRAADVVSALDLDG